MNEAIDILLRTAAAALLLDIDEVRKIIHVGRQAITGLGDGEPVKRILTELDMAEAVLDATEAYAKTLIVISREHRETISRRLH